MARGARVRAPWADPRASLSGGRYPGLTPRSLARSASIASMLRTASGGETIPRTYARGVAVARRASGFSLDQLRYQYPSEVVPEGMTPIGHLTRLTWEGAGWRYPDGVPDKVRSQVAYELAMIEELGVKL